MNCRIKSRHDVLSNWVSADIVLLDGEIAVVDCGAQTRFKIGDGTRSFTQLPFVDQSQLSTKVVYAEHISQGLHASSVPYGLAAGAYLCADASFSQALGYNSQTVSSDQYAFAWNGDDTRMINDYYQSHGKGTFNVNPLSGLSGFYIGEQSLADILSSSGNKVTIVDNTLSISQQSDLSVVKLDVEEYAQMVATSSTISNCLYIVESSCMNAYGQQLKNLAAPTDLSDATTKEYVDNAISNIEIPDDLSSFANSPGYLVSDDISGYYKKTETSSASEISTALENFQPAGNPIILPKASISRSGTAFTLSANCTNTLQQTIDSDNILVLEDYDYDNIYDIELTTANSTSAVSFEILAHTTLNNVEGLYDIGLGSQLSTLSPNQKYKFSISHEKLHIENDNALRSLSSSAKTIPYVGDYADFYPVVDSFNSINALDFYIAKAFIVMPQSIKSDGFTKSRSFSLQILNHTFDYSPFLIQLSAVDAGGANVNFYTVEGDAISSIIDQKLSSYQVVFEETTTGNFLVSRKASVPTDLSAFTNSPGYVKGVELAQMFSQVNNPKSSVNSLVETMTSVLNILKSLQ